VTKNRIFCGTVLLLLLRLLVSALIELSPQEAYYWNYAIHPDLSYLEHPPMIAWVIRAGTLLLGKTEIGVRLGGLLLIFFSTWLIYLLGRLWFGRRAGLWAAFLFQLIPVYFVYGVIITPDVPLICFWLVTIYLISIAVLKNKGWAWYLAGISLGFSILSKYTGFFLIPSTFLFLIVDRDGRKWLITKEPYLGLLLSLVVFSPTILWNFQHQWASFDFQIGRRLEEAAAHHGGSLLPFLLIQMGVTFPTFFLGLLLSLTFALYLTIRNRGSKWKLCLFFSFPILVFFTAYSAWSLVKANWNLPGYLSLLLGAYPSYRYLRYQSGKTFKIVYRRVVCFSFCSIPALYILALFHMTVTIPYVPINKWVTGWEELGKIVEKEKTVFETETHQKAFVLGMDSHYVASELAFYMQRSNDVFPRVLLGKNALAFEFWKPEVYPRGSNAIAVDTGYPNIALLHQHFSQVDENVMPVSIIRKGKIVRYFYLIRCYNYLGPSARHD
jgi:dolichol-phosphate mannosyltransferase